MGNITESSEIPLQMASMHRVMGRSATFVNTMLIGSRPNRANTTCSHENMWREEENKKTILHTFPDDKSGAKRGENTSYWSARESGTKQDPRQTERNRLWIQRVEQGRCLSAERGRVRGLEQRFSSIDILECQAAIRLKQILSAEPTQLQRVWRKHRAAGECKALGL